MAVRSVSIRIEQEMLDKLSYVAEYEGRSLNSHILVLIRRDIQNFEKTWGPITGQIGKDVNVKPSKHSPA